MLRQITGSSGTKYTFRDDSTLGSGCNACVYKAFDWKAKQYVAIKVVNYVRLKHRRRGSSCGTEKEVNLLNTVKNSDNVIRILDSAKDQDYMYIITELYSEGTLQELLSYSPYGYLEEEDALKCFYDIVKGLSMLHSKEVMHRDINLENVFIKQGRCFIGDFGSATQNLQSETLAGNHEYRAPEIFKVKDGFSYTKSVDIWSIGIVLHELLYGKKPYEGDIEELPKLIRANLYSAPIFPKVSKQTRTLLERMLITNPVKRIKIDEIFGSSLFVKYEKREESRQKEKESGSKVQLDKPKRYNPQVISTVFSKHAPQNIWILMLLILLIVFFSRR